MTDLCIEALGFDTRIPIETERVHSNVDFRSLDHAVMLAANALWPRLPGRRRLAASNAMVRRPLERVHPPIAGSGATTRLPCRPEALGRALCASHGQLSEPHSGTYVLSDRRWPIGHQ